jgi:hypothetical protein
MNNIEKNKLICEFMDIKPKLESPDVYSYSDTPFISCRGNINQVTNAIYNYVKYDTDWNWLMSVVIKIQLLDIVHDNTRDYDKVFKEWKCTFSPSYTTHDFGYIVGKSKNSEMEAVYNACIEFIKWYLYSNKSNNDTTKL